ncbi:MAG: C39 family peptidase [Thermoproteota archaeon]
MISAMGGTRQERAKVKMIVILATFWMSDLAGCAMAQKGCGSLAEAVGTRLPRSHLIAGVLQHKQINGLGCGPASIEIVFDYWGVDVDQKAIADVARASSMGTWAYDIVRTGHFSHLSSASGRFFPHDAPKFGFPERAKGYASFSFSSENPWWTELKRLVASDIPVILLMK